MKTTFFYVCNILLLVAICFSSCKKEKLEENKTTDKSTVLANNEKQNTDIKYKMLPTGDISPLVYIGDSQWRGLYNGVTFIFYGISDTQLMDGNLHVFSIVSAKSGDLDASCGNLNGNAWTVTRYGVSISYGDDHSTNLTPTQTTFSIMIVQVGSQLQIQSYNGTVTPPPTYY